MSSDFLTVLVVSYKRCVYINMQTLIILFCVLCIYFSAFFEFAGALDSFFIWGVFHVLNHIGIAPLIFIKVALHNLLFFFSAKSYSNNRDLNRNRRYFVYMCLSGSNFLKQLAIHSPNIIISWIRSETIKTSNCRSSRPEVFCKKVLLRNFVKFTGKHLWQCLF